MHPPVAPAPKGRPRPRPRPALVALLALGSLLASCRPSTFIPWEVALEYQRTEPLGQIVPGWNLVGIQRSPEEPYLLVRKVRVGPEVAGGLLMESARARSQRIAAIACPGPQEEIWTRIAPEHDIQVEMIGDNGTFATVECRSLVRPDSASSGGAEG